MKLALLVFFFFPLLNYGQSLFTSIPSQQSGIRFENKIRESSEGNVLNYEYFYNGGGVAVGDLNNDGLPDIVFTSNMAQPKVYFNKGNFVFEDVSAKSKIRADGWKTGCYHGRSECGWLAGYLYMQVRKW